MLNMTFSDYLKRRIAELGIRQVDVIRATGASKGTVSLWFLGDTIPSTKFASSLAKVLEVDSGSLTDALEHNRAPKEPTSKARYDREHIEIPLLEAYVNGGDGHEYVMPEAPSFMRHLYFRKDWLEYEHLMPENLVVWMVYGKSMAPLLNEGDVILIDRSISTLAQVTPGRVYALNYKGVPLVKRLKTTEMGNYLLVSDNKSEEYPPIPADQDEIHIAGQVVWRGGSVL
jgi:phage repressor protein C with HTH and peptisase S24 domain